MKYNPTRIATYLANKKRLLYLAVVSGAVLLIFIGVPIEQAITNGAEQQARMYQTALQVDSDEYLNYSIDTKQGRVLAPVTIKSVDLVKFPEMNKEFPYVHKLEETYTQHSRQVCTHDEEGNVEECHTEYYFTWDTTDTWSLQANEVEMAGRKYPFSLFSLSSHNVPAKEIIDGEDGEYVYIENKGWLDIGLGADEGDIRYSYDVISLPQSGTVFLDVSESVHPAIGNKINLYTENSEDLVKSAQNSVQTKSTIFTVFWTFLVLSVVIGGGYATYNKEY